ncbi:hypothetical protein B0T22DRAFT_457607 [Podospora appendiculata]|uniref:Uncharacterized protein n=1 Tax=Podospora appendiculata TaxID=314037 RepID=A0AAE0X876_9PEZI|nr:hypothetical protein B0T22DRAFT_457607 [Podospora appendiculata]
MSMSDGAWSVICGPVCPLLLGLVPLGGPPLQADSHKHKAQVPACLPPRAKVKSGCATAQDRKGTRYGGLVVPRYLRVYVLSLLTAGRGVCAGLNFEPGDQRLGWMDGGPMAGVHNAPSYS